VKLVERKYFAGELKEVEAGELNLSDGMPGRKVWRCGVRVFEVS